VVDTFSILPFGTTVVFDFEGADTLATFVSADENFITVMFNGFYTGLSREEVRIPPTMMLELEPQLKVLREASERDERIASLLESIPSRTTAFKLARAKF